MGKFAKSFAKGAKYAGLFLGAAAVGAVAQPDIVSGALVGALTGVGAPPIVALLVGQYAVPVVVSALAGAAHQIVKHRDEIFEESEG